MNATTLVLTLLALPAHAHQARPSEPSHPDRIAAAVSGLAEREYGFSRRDDGAWSAPNRAHGLRCRIAASGLELVPREGRGAARDWSLALRTLDFGREGAERASFEPAVEPAGARLELRGRDGAMTEWFENDARGLEQGWTLAERPPGAERALRIGIEARGLRAAVAADGLSAVFLDDHGAVRLRYEGLCAWDADGRDVDVRLVETPRGFDVRVDDRGARYPLTVDPFFRAPDWEAYGGQQDAQFGVSVAGAGDVNGDGYDDVLVGAWLYDDGEPGEGAAFLFLGSAGGPSPSPDWTATSDRTLAFFGISVAGAGDVNGDGYDDVVVGAYGYENGESSEGAAYLFLGSAAGPSTTPDWQVEGDGVIAQLGISVAGAGDVDADGYADVIVGAFGYDGGESGEGRALLYRGSATGLSTFPSWTAEGGQAGAAFGRSVSGAGDLNGDGYGDVIVGAPGYDGTYTDAGRGFVFLGSASGPSPTPDWTADGHKPYGSFGFSVAGAGDVDGDGFEEVLLGEPFAQSGADGGGAFLFRGSPGGPSSQPDWSAPIGPTNLSVGGSVAGAGDVNGDGFDDALVGDRSFANGEQGEGAVFLFLGSAQGLSLDPDGVTEGDQVGASLGVSVAGAGDVNGDAASDTIVGASWYDDGNVNDGAAFLHLGQPLPCGTVYCDGSNAADIVVDTCSCSATSIHIELDGAPAGQFAYLLVGAGQGVVIDPPGAQGDLCLAGAPIGRYVLDAGTTDGSGGMSTDVLNAVTGGGGGALPNPPGGNLCSPPGQTWNFQYWHRDGMNPSKFSKALSVTFAD